MTDQTRIEETTIATKDMPNGQSDTPPLAAMPPPSEDSREQLPGKLTKAAIKRRESLSRLLTRNDTGVNDPDFVHDTRVAARRLGEVSRLLQRFMDKPTAKAVDASLKSLRRSMGDLRDSDVTCEHLLKWRMPAPVKAIAKGIAETLQTRRPQLAQAAREQMTSASVTGALVILARILEDRARPESAAETERQLAQIVATHLKKRDKQMRRAFGKAARKQTPESLHEARIAVKKLRYVLELSQDASTPGAKQKVRFLKQLQQLLGDHHDVHLIVEQVQAHLKDRRNPPPKALAPAWRKWQRDMNTAQAQRAGIFLAKSYAWMNA